MTGRECDRESVRECDGRVQWGEYDRESETGRVQEGMSATGRECDRERVRQGECERVRQGESTAGRE